MKHLLLLLMASILLFGCENKSQAEEYQSFDFEQQRQEAVEEATLLSLRREMELNKQLTNNLLDDVAMLMDFTLMLHNLQQENIDSLSSNLLAVHECAQMREFANRAKTLCDDEVGEHWCRVVATYRAQCNILDENEEICLPDGESPSLNQQFNFSASQE